MALSGSVMAVAATSLSVPPLLAVLFGIAVSTGMGFLNGFIITKGKIQPFVATLGMYTALEGVALLVTDGLPISGIPEQMLAVGSQSAGGVVPYSIFVFAAVAAVSYTHLAGLGKIGHFNQGMVVFKRTVRVFQSQAVHAGSQLDGIFHVRIIKIRCQGGKVKQALTIGINGCAPIHVGNSEGVDGPVAVGIRPVSYTHLLTTREPDDGMIEVALVSFLAAEGNMTDEEIAALAEKYGHKIDGSPVEKGECAADTQEAVLEANE